MRRRRLVECCMLFGLLVSLTIGASATSASEVPALRVATVDVDATPPVGSPVAYALTQSVVDPLHAKAIVLLPRDQSPIVLFVVDWIGIANAGHDWWREGLAAAAGTTADRVAVHVVHQHDGAQCDRSVVALLSDPARVTPHFDEVFLDRVKSNVEQAIRESLPRAQEVTHIGFGKGEVHQVASNRRLLGPDGKVAKMRFSSCRDAEAIAAPEGVIDPYVRLVSFWNGDQALACLAYYATHPMSHYGKGDVSADFVGLARAAREQATHVPHLYFTGAGGNIAAGKYNDGSPEHRAVLADRMAEGMQKAWETTVRKPLEAGQVEWRVDPVLLPVGKHLDAAKLKAKLADATTSDQDRFGAAADLAWLERCQAGRTIDLTCLRIGTISILHMPGELFVEYQLAAQAMHPDGEVCLAAYGEYGPGYIGTTRAYAEGGYETSEPASRVAPEVEPLLMAALQRLLNAD
jgi:hypothetical protein